MCVCVCVCECVCVSLCLLTAFASRMSSSLPSWPSRRASTSRGGRKSLPPQTAWALSARELPGPPRDPEAASPGAGGGAERPDGSPGALVPSAVLRP